MEGNYSSGKHRCGLTDGIGPIAAVIVKTAGFGNVFLVLVCVRKQCSRPSLRTRVEAVHPTSQKTRVVG